MAFKQPALYTGIVKGIDKRFYFLRKISLVKIMQLYSFSFGIYLKLPTCLRKQSGHQKIERYREIKIK